MTERLSPRTALSGGLLLWFAVLGGVLSWTVHSLAAWSIDELTCEAGHDNLAGFPLTGAIALTVLVPAAGAAAALALSVLAWRRTRADLPSGRERSVGRAHLLAFVGLWLNMLALSMIVLGGMAALVLPPCQR
ncbi:hypothetical protein [Plantactinospora sp. KLBMP9567]|uniref:hypothetical protein n=1 Tax=Plantactinospora sp. KLBMP9567 TaxID=3085900 RepID=UPI0029811275|nr:hypothetical protein [Plantactinospora sp. KLBMP9567]MDW5329661.1 hypothetical protein [Plantactinospora sp. KLBMP9567]